jgi:hypothetical protein
MSMAPISTVVKIIPSNIALRVIYPLPRNEFFSPYQPGKDITTQILGDLLCPHGRGVKNGGIGIASKSADIIEVNPWTATH